MKLDVVKVHFAQLIRSKPNTPVVGVEQRAQRQLLEHLKIFKCLHIIISTTDIGGTTAFVLADQTGFAILSVEEPNNQLELSMTLKTFVSLRCKKGGIWTETNDNLTTASVVVACRYQRLYQKGCWAGLFEERYSHTATHSLKLYKEVLHLLRTARCTVVVNGA